MSAERPLSRSVSTGAGAALVAGAASLLLALAGHAEASWRGLLIAFLYVGGVAGGAVAWTGVVAAARGRWAREMERPMLAAVAFAPVSVLAFVLLWAGHASWAVWEGHAFGGRRIWLSPSFLFPRDLVALLLFWGVATWHVRRRLRGDARRSGAVLCLVYALVFTLVGIDFVMSLSPTYSSSVLGAYVFMSGLYAAVAAWGVVAAWRGARPAYLATLGNLLLGFCMLTTYLMFAQFLVDWYENLPLEAVWLAPRMAHGAWVPVTVVLLATVYLGPIVLLLNRRAKRVPWGLLPVCLLVLGGMWVERWWLVAPAWTHAVRFDVAELLPTLALGGLLLAAAGLLERRLPQPPEIGDA